MKYILFFLFVGLLITCGVKDNQISENIALGYAETWPEQYFHPENQLTSDRILLGRTLFYDTRLSRDSSLSCASCHLQSHAFSDTIAISAGVKGAKGFRNAPSLMNLSFVDRAHKDGGVQSIDLQAMTPIEDHEEMDLALVHAVKRFTKDEKINALAQKAYHRNLDNYSLVFGLGAFVKSLVSNQSKYDAVIQEKDQYTASEALGFELFSTHCSSCHIPPLFASNIYINNGTRSDYSNDLGRMRINGDSLDIGKFRVPSLRNIELTYPYMHAGHLSSLEDILKHYNGEGEFHENQDPRVTKIRLDQKEQAAVISFLHTLTDYSIIENKGYSQPIE